MTLTTRFPDRLTVLDAQGQRLGSEGVILKERSKLLIVAPRGEDELRLTKMVSDEYKRRFDQESVLLAAEDVCVSFS